MPRKQIQTRQAPTTAVRYWSEFGRIWERVYQQVYQPEPSSAPWVFRNAEQPAPALAVTVPQLKLEPVPHFSCGPMTTKQLLQWVQEQRRQDQDQDLEPRRPPERESRTLWDLLKDKSCEIGGGQ